MNGLWKIRRQRGRGVGGSIAASGGRGEHRCVSVSLQALRGFDFEGDQYVALPDWQAEKTWGWLIDRSGSSPRKLNTVHFCNLPVECGTDGKWRIKAPGAVPAVASQSCFVSLSHFFQGSWLTEPDGQICCDGHLRDERENSADGCRTETVGTLKCVTEWHARKGNEGKKKNPVAWFHFFFAFQFIYLFFCIINM